MPSDANLIDAASPLRGDGVVFLDPQLAAGPAAHVLVVGVAAYAAPKYARLLDTATVSARRVADWFLRRGGGGGYDNPNCGLGSLAIVLSETPDGKPADYAGGPVPRATFEATKNALRKWVLRVQTHRDNLAILYVASHGESFQGRTAFLLEDYGTDPLDATAGMAEVEQFISSMNNAEAIRQLMIFDCCRNPTAAALPWDGDFGNKIITLTRRPNDHGIARKQWVICSTTLGQVAFGRKGLPTLFNDALIDSLNGVAGDTSEEDWPVRPGLLVDRIDRILSLQRLSADEKPQTPAGRMAGTFDITLPGERPEVPVYIGLEDPGDWPGATITLKRPGAADVTVVGKEGESPFFKETVAERTAITVEASRGGGGIGSAAAKVRTPVTFVEVRRVPVAAPTVVGHLAAAAADGVAGGRLEVTVAGPMRAEAAATLDIVRRNGTAADARHLVVAIGATTEVDVAAGDHGLTLRTPDGTVRTRDVTVAAGAIVAVSFETARSEHEWLATATLSGAIGAPVEAPAAAPPPPEPKKRRKVTARRGPSRGSISFPGGLGDALGGLFSKKLFPVEAMVEAGDDASEAADEDLDASEPAGAEPPEPPVLRSRVVGGYGVDLEARPAADPKLTLVSRDDDGRFRRIDVEETVDVRFLRSVESQAAAPVFAEITFGERREIAVVPAIGHRYGTANVDWRPHLIVDRAAPAMRPMTTALVEDRIWSGLLGFLGSRDMVSGGRLLDGDMRQRVEAAIWDKLENPLAAAAGALIAVSVADPTSDETWDPWLRNLADWFPGIPDGAVILGWRLLNRATSTEALADARRRLTEGFRRGVPVHSLAVDWLARGLESLPGEDDELVAMQRTARRLANRVDSTRVYTVVRLSDRKGP